MPSLRFRYQTIEFGDAGNMDIHLRTLRDKQQFSDKNHIAENLGISSASWPIFGVVWDSSRILADLMHDFDIKGKRILEVGCGIGLASLVLNKRQADITATDYHPEVENFLKINALLNNDQVIPFVRTGWADDDCGIGSFDLIIGSDLLYESEHVELLSEFIDQHAKQQCEVILIDPGRGHHAKFSRKMVGLGYVHTQTAAIPNDAMAKGYKGQVLRYERT